MPIKYMAIKTQGMKTPSFTTLSITQTVTVGNKQQALNNNATLNLLRSQKRGLYVGSPSLAAVAVLLS
jgi:hypothetical protein